MQMVDVHNVVNFVEEANENLLGRDLYRPFLVLHCE